MTFFDIFSKKQLKQNNKKTISIEVDFREKNSLVPSHLEANNINVIFKQLPIADYIINDFAIERKTISDLKSSIINKRIFFQIQELKQFPFNLIIIEGSKEELFNNEVLHENAVRGFLLSLAREKIPFIITKDEKETAKYLSILARKKPKKDIQLRPSKISLSKKEQLRYILEGFPSIGPATARALLKEFKSLKSIINASEEELKKILKSKTKSFLDLISNS